MPAIWSSRKSFLETVDELITSYENKGTEAVTPAFYDGFFESADQYDKGEDSY